MTGNYINDLGYEVPENKILVIPHSLEHPTYYEQVVSPLKNNPKRGWFNPHAYYCLPLTIGNQYGFVINSLRDFTITWDGTENDAQVTLLNSDNENVQTVKTGFGAGIVTIQNRFSLKTPPGINLMTIQPPNMFIPGCVALTGVVECDNLRRDFTFNFKVTVPNITIGVRKGDPVGAFIPIPRYFVDNFNVEPAETYFSKDVLNNEIADSNALSKERTTVDLQKTHQSGRRYFNGQHVDGDQYPDHQKRL